MAGLQLKNKVEKEKVEKTSKNGKHKRKRDVFGKSLTRIGIIVLVVLEVVAFAAIKVFFTLSQNKKQDKIEEDIRLVNKKINQYNAQLQRKAETYENVGNLIATLPTSFDQASTDLDMRRMVTLSGLSLASSSAKQISLDDVTSPIEFKIDTVKAHSIKISLVANGTDCTPYLDFIDYLSNYKQENFYYVESFDFSFNPSSSATACTFNIYTFYNDVVTTPTN